MYLKAQCVKYTILAIYINIVTDTKIIANIIIFYIIINADN